jgi:hypothetical protein
MKGWATEALIFYWLSRKISLGYRPADWEEDSLAIHIPTPEEEVMQRFGLYYLYKIYLSIFYFPHLPEVRSV